MKLTRPDSKQAPNILVGSETGRMTSNYTNILEVPRGRATDLADLIGMMVTIIVGIRLVQALDLHSKEDSWRQEVIRLLRTTK